MKNRREFLSVISAIPAASVLGTLSACGGSDGSFETSAASDELAWKNIEGMFRSDIDTVAMNIDALSILPITTLAAKSQPVLTSNFTTLDEQRSHIARLFRIDKNQIALTRSASVALVEIIGGLPWEKGDIIITTSQEHPVTVTQLEIAKSFLGVEIIYVDIGLKDDFSGQNILSRFNDQIEFAKTKGRRVKALVWSSPTYLTGALIPPDKMAKLARDNDVLSICDGAHMLGMLDFNIDKIDVDIIITSGSKWQAASRGTGIIFFNKKMIGKNILPNRGQVIYKDTSLDVSSLDLASKLSICHKSRIRNFNALTNSCDIWSTIGRDKIGRYILSINDYLKRRIEEEWGMDSIFSRGIRSEYCSGLLTFSPYANTTGSESEIKIKGLVDRLHDEFKIAVKPILIKTMTSSEEMWAIRLSTPIWIGKDEINHFVDVTKKLTH